MHRVAWILDDRFDDARALAFSLEAAGYTTEKNTDIDALHEPVHAVIEGKKPVPDIVVIDQNWDVFFTNLEVLGREDIEIPSQHSAGIALAQYIRSYGAFSSTELIMTSSYDEGIAIDEYKLAPVRILSKNDMKSFGSRLNSALAETQNSANDDDYISGVLMYLRALASEIGLSDDNLIRVIGGRGALSETVSVESLLRASRDSRARLDIVLRAFTLFRESYGPKLPDLAKIEADFNEPIRKILLEGDFAALLNFRSRIENRAGGPLG